MAPTTTSIIKGSPIEALDAFGHWNRRVALSGITEGGDFLIVWQCREEEWAAALRDNREPVGVPWPAEDVRPAS